jgi:predicted ribosomally synthesized peptide with SipW-like signal peptide
MTFLSISFNRAQRHKLVLFGALAIGVLALAAGRGTLAYFTTQTSSSGNAFTAGTLHLQASDNNEGPLASVSTSITFANMKPGDKVYAPIELDNVGTLSAKYGVIYATATTGTNLAPGLALAMRSKGAGTGTILTCNGTTFAAAVAGSTAVWGTPVRTTAPMVSAGESVVAVGSGLVVAPAAFDVLCIEVVFTEPASADNTYNNAVNGATNTTVTFTFDGLASAAPVITNP